MKKHDMANLKKAVLTAGNHLANGEPVEAVSALELALLLPMTHNDRRAITQAKGEADMGSPEKAETLLGIVTFKEPTQSEIECTPRRFRFNPKKGETPDGLGRSNGTRADDAEEMLSLVPDVDQLSSGDALRDALANLMHWCDREKVDFNQALMMARAHHEAEK